MKIHIATSRPVGERCAAWARAAGYELAPMDACDIFISVMYDTLLHPDYIATRPCYNFHPGVLPEYRGSGAFSWAIINGERDTGVTLHRIDGDIDHGPIVEVRRFPISPRDTAEALFRQAERMMEEMFRDWLPILLSGRVPERPQEEAYAGMYYRKELERAKDLTRYVRAFTFAGKESAYFINPRGERVHIEWQ